MKIKYIVFPVVAVAFASCSTAYRTGQTPDDVYYSPAPVESSYVNTISDKERNSYSYKNDYNSRSGSDLQAPDYNPSVTYDLGYGYAPYGYTALSYNPYFFNSYVMASPFYGYDPLGYMNFYNPFAYNYYGYAGLMGYYSLYGYNNPYNYYNPYSYYAPYYGHSTYITSGTSNNYRPRTNNLNAYTNTRPSNTNTTNTPSVPIRRSTGVGNVIRRVFTPSRSNNNYYTPSNNNRSYNNSNNSRTFNTEQAPSRTFNNSPSYSAPSSSGSGSAPVRSFRR